MEEGEIGRVASIRLLRAKGESGPIGKLADAEMLRTRRLNGGVPLTTRKGLRGDDRFRFALNPEEATMPALQTATKNHADRRRHRRGRPPSSPSLTLGSECRPLLI